MRAGFKGCIRDFESEDENLRERPLDISVDFAKGENQNPARLFVNVMKCGCKDKPCQNDGICAQREKDFRCDCKLGFTGPHCEIKSKIFRVPLFCCCCCCCCFFFSVIPLREIFDISRYSQFKVRSAVISY